MNPAPADQSSRPVVLMHVTFPPSGEIRGGARSILMTARHLRRYRPVFVVNRESSYLDDLHAAGIEAHVLPAERNLDGFRAASPREKLDRIWRIWNYDRALIAVARKTGAVLLHCQDMSETLTAGLAMKLSGRSVVWHVRDQSENRRMWMFSGAAALASRVVFNAEPLRQEYLDLAPAQTRAFLERRSVSIPNGIDVETIQQAYAKLDRTESRRALGIDGDTFVLSVIGPLQPKKNQLAFLERAGASLLALRPDLRIVFIGSERQEPLYAAKVRRVANALSPERIQFVPELPHARMVEVYASTDIVCIPSQIEGLPRVALEAQALGCPVVASRNAGNLGAVMEGETALLVDLARLEEITPAVAKLADPRIHARMSQTAIAHARAAFDIHAVTLQIEETYDLCAKSKGSR